MSYLYTIYSESSKQLQEQKLFFLPELVNSDREEEWVCFAGLSNHHSTSGSGGSWEEKERKHAGKRRGGKTGMLSVL